MMVGVARDIPTVKRRIADFLASDTRGKEPLKKLLQDAVNTGPTAIFGGMVRDICMGGSRSFFSDVDIVIDIPQQQFNKWLCHRYPDFTSNAFGGARLHLGVWSMDIWPLESTWAIREGHVEAKALPDLVKTTFFSWDAWVYELHTRHVHAHPQVLVQMQANTVDINLEPNPRPQGIMVRALRWLSRHRPALSPRLAAYLHRQVSAGEATGVAMPGSFLDRVNQELARYVTANMREPFHFPAGEQLAFEFARPGSTA